MAISVKTKIIPVYLKVIILAGVFLIPVLLFIFLVFNPKTKEIKVLESSISKLENEIRSAEVKVRKLDILKAENEKLKKRLEALKEQLPEEKEVSVLLKQISDLGFKSGLLVLLWKPMARKPDPRGVHVEIPVSMRVVGGYHDLGIFFSYISKIKRIVNISNINITPSDQADYRLISSTFTASTFSAVN